MDKRDRLSLPGVVTSCGSRDRRCRPVQARPEVAAPHLPNGSIGVPHAADTSRPYMTHGSMRGEIRWFHHSLSDEY